MNKEAFLRGYFYKEAAEQPTQQEMPATLSAPGAGYMRRQVQELIRKQILQNPDSKHLSPNTLNAILQDVDILEPLYQEIRKNGVTEEGMAKVTELVASKVKTRGKADIFKKYTGLGSSQATDRKYAAPTAPTEADTEKAYDTLTPHLVNKQLQKTQGKGPGTLLAGQLSPEYMKTLSKDIQNLDMSNPEAVKKLQEQAISRGTADIMQSVGKKALGAVGLGVAGLAGAYGLTQMYNNNQANRRHAELMAAMQKNRGMGQQQAPGVGTFRLSEGQKMPKQDNSMFSAVTGAIPGLLGASPGNNALANNSKPAPQNNPSNNGSTFPDPTANKSGNTDPRYTA